MTELILDLITLILIITLFCLIILFLIIYSRKKLKKVLRRINNLERT